MSKGVDPGVLICLEVIWAGVILYIKAEMEIIFFVSVSYCMVPHISAFVWMSAVDAIKEFNSVNWITEFIWLQQIS